VPLRELIQSTSSPHHPRVDAAKETALPRRRGGKQHSTKAAKLGKAPARRRRDAAAANQHPRSRPGK